MNYTRCLTSTNGWRYWHRFAITLMSLLMMSFSICPAALALVVTPVTPTTFYVSKNGDNSDGLTWETAWNDLDQIQWDQINVGHRDVVVIDGGARRMIYRKTLNVQKFGDHCGIVQISVSDEAGHDGQVVIAPGINANGINVPGSGVRVNANKRSGMLIWGAKVGINVAQDRPFGIDFKNIEVARCREAGVQVAESHFFTSLTQMIIHDNATNVIAGSGSPGATVINKCWIYNNSYRVNSDGVKVIGRNNSPPTQGVRLTDCVLGPGLRDGLNNETPAIPTVKNCLFINATRNNVSSASVFLENITSFMARRNPMRMSHSCLKLDPSIVPYLGPTPRVEKSIFFGGMVEVPLEINPYPGAPSQPFPINVADNTQFRTTGNTMLLSTTMENPLFQSRVGKVRPRTPIRILKRLVFFHCGIIHLL